MNQQSKLELYFNPVNIKKIHPNSIINFDLYLKTNEKFVLYKNRNLQIKADDIRRLVGNQIETLFIHEKDRKNYRNYLENNLEELLKSDSVPIEKKAEALYESAINVVEDIFRNPRSGDSIKRSKEIVNSSVDFILTAPEAFVNLLKIRRHDYYTYTHSVNVCTFLVSLSQQVGITDKKTLLQVGEGGLLHDLGKSKIPSSIINKAAKLTNSEWEIMKEHPAYGVQIAQSTRDISDVSLIIIGQHHEKLSGKGYPQGLNSSELNEFANMASIIDIYDAITTNRSYQSARSAVEAAQILLDIKGDFNQEMLLRFLKMLAVK